MKKYADISLKYKIIVIIFFSVFIPLILAISLILLNGSKFYKNELYNKVSLSAKIISDISVADIMFNSPDVSTNSISFIGKNANFLQITIFTKNGGIFSEYSKDNFSKKEVLYKNENVSYFENENFYYYHIIKSNGIVYGTISIVTSTEELKAKVFDFLLGTTFIAILILALAIYVGEKFAGNLIIPIENLVEKAGQITKNDSYDVQLQKLGQDEIGKLYDSLNIMLSNINSRRMERDAAISSLKVSEKNFREIFNSSHDAIFIHNLNKDIMDVNETMSQMYSIARNEALTLSFEKEFSSKNNNFASFEKIWSNVVNNYPQEFNWIAQKPKTGEEFIVQVNLKKILLSDNEIILSTVRDITEIIKANDRLQKSETKLQKIFDILQVGVGLLSNRNIIEINNKACELIGYSREELVGKDSSIIYKSELDFLRFSEIAVDEIAKNGFSHNEIEWVRKDNKIITVILDLMQLDFEVDGQGYILFSFLDITNLKKAEKDIKELNADLENRVNKRTAELEFANRELEAFSYSVSHDLRAPLRGIREFSKIILEDNMENLDDDGKTHLLKVINHTVAMNHLIDDLLKLSKLSQEKIVLENFKIEEIVNSVINSFNDSLPFNNVEFIVNCNYNVVADPSLMRIAITNLFSNAIKFTSKIKNPTIEFGSFSALESKEKFGIENVVFFVKDNGAGFNMKYVNKLFGAFQRIHSTKDFEGSGIGLATVNRIIKKHGGKIWADGKIDEGATFFFTLSDSPDFNL
ncbi:MAG: PAS domain S-box protein [Bacteroidetes bacterium]|nr:PAS domain S-box protein [Bacteroidota bacterium]MBU1113570.1 PAS domain S-box protein [Bacteroidota bacterium]MBU1798628.1 PAS domain S-box protein [Bacteroidota bacterium]